MRCKGGSVKQSPDFCRREDVAVKEGDGLQGITGNLSSCNKCDGEIKEDSNGRGGRQRARTASQFFITSFLVAGGAIRLKLFSK